MKFFNIFSLLVVLAFAQVVRAETMVIFGGSQAMIMLQGNDTDARTLYDAMNVAAKDESTTVSVKEIVYNTPIYEPVFSISCHASKLNNTSGACVIKIFVGDYSNIDKKNQKAVMEIVDSEIAGELANQFVSKDQNAPTSIIFKTLNERFQISKSIDSKGNITSIKIEFHER